MDIWLYQSPYFPYYHIVCDLRSRIPGSIVTYIKPSSSYVTRYHCRFRNIIWTHFFSLYKINTFFWIKHRKISNVSKSPQSNINFIDRWDCFFFFVSTNLTGSFLLSFHSDRCLLYYCPAIKLMCFLCCILISNAAVLPVVCFIRLPGIRMFKRRNYNRCCFFRCRSCLTCSCYLHLIGSRLRDCKSSSCLTIQSLIIFIPLIAVRNAFIVKHMRCLCR